MYQAEAYLSAYKTLIAVIRLEALSQETQDSMDEMPSLPSFPECREGPGD